MRTGKYLFKNWIVCFVCLFAFAGVVAQPANDNCANAKTITISNGGYGTGTFTSSTDDISAATVQSGEYFPVPLALANLNKKSMWYKFTLSALRKISVSLLQPGTAIGSNDAGFTVYKANTCLPGQTQISSQLTPLTRFGTTTHPCVPPGDYFIQVSTNSTANGPLFIQLQVSDSTGAVYDHPSTAYDFGVLPRFGKYVDYPVDCQSVEDASETCTALPYGKTTWQTFTTPAYFDYISFLFSGTGQPTPFFDLVFNSTNFGYKLYKGDAKTGGISSLTLVDGCDTLKSDGQQAAYRMYTCEQLLPNTTYTVQLFFHESFFRDVRVGFYTGGTGPAKGPIPTITGIQAPNKLGVISVNVNSNTVNVTDNLGCNSRHSLHPCSSALPADGIPIDGFNYNLSTFFTFTLNTTSRMSFNAYGGCGGLLVRLYKQDLTNSCSDLDTINRVAQFFNFSFVDCLQPGNYIIQVSGDETIAGSSYFTSLTATSSKEKCLKSLLGLSFDLDMEILPQQGPHNFSLNAAGKYDAINSIGGVMQPLANGVKYTALPDTLGCLNTVLPDTVCGAVTRAIYREFVVADSGYVQFTGTNKGNHILFRGDANALATSQNAFTYPKKLTGLTTKSPCFKNDPCGAHRFCVTPGTYTLATFGDNDLIGAEEKPTVTLNPKSSLHYSPQTAQDMGSIIDLLPGGSGTMASDTDYFSCRDNAVMIAGLAPCSNPSNTKAIYRQFYLKQPSTVSIKHIDTCENATSFFTLFKGKATDGASALSAMPAEWRCHSNKGYSSPLCSPLAAGWYTIVSYGTGPSYSNHLQGLNSTIGLVNQVFITVTPACPAPKFSRPYKAAVDSITGQPFLIEWKDKTTSTLAYPRSDTSYTLRRENFNCSIDTPFSNHPIVACNANIRRVAYYVFKVNQPSYIQINNLADYWAVVYPFDVRTDSALMASNTPIQPCIKGIRGTIQLCDVQPGSYTLAVFAGDISECRSVQPIIYVDRAGTARFDHAANAYDFGVVPADSTWYNGKVGDVNPLNPQRAPSNDFFYCNTGAQIKDPNNAVCNTDYRPSIYANPQNNSVYSGDRVDSFNVPRRNLWYTFVADKPGWIHVKLDTKTPGKTLQHNFAIYKSDEDGSLPFSTLVNTGKVDSTLAQGLTYIEYNGPFPNFCYGKNEAIFYRDPCLYKKPTRYYVLAEFSGGYPIHDYPPNNQVELSVRIDSVPNYSTLYDKYSDAYNFGIIGPGAYTGGTDNYSCATKDATDPVYAYNLCTKTLWYKFTTTVTGNVRYRIVVNGNRLTSIDQLQIFRQTKDNDSTSAGLSILNTSPVLVTDAASGTWAQACIYPGTYYLLLPGCNKGSETVYPELQIIEAAGDFCSRPAVSTLSGAGVVNTTAIIDCHTIGGDYGEYNPTVTCPNGDSTFRYKTSWFRLDVNGTDTLDITTFLTENTTTASSNIKYRMMSGNCGAMQEQSCVLDALTQNTYKCLTPGSYFFQVFTPTHLMINNVKVPVTGDISLHINAVKHVDSCGVINNCLATANFTPSFNCATDTTVRFVNYSTFGDSMRYHWDFGYNGQTSTAISPSFNYPILSTPATYAVKLRAINLGCGGKDSVTVNVTIPARPKGNLADDTLRCTPGNITLNASTWPGTTYLWNTGATTSSITVNTPGSNKFYVKLTYNGCVTSDTILVNINPVTGKNQNVVLCPNADSVLLTNYRNLGEEHYWSNGGTDFYIYAKTLGTYYDSMSWKGCPAKDIYNVITPTYNPLGNDTTTCLKQPLILNATSSGALAYQWQNGSGSPIFTVTVPGKYWVNVIYPNCSFRDTITVNNVQPQLRSADTAICSGQTLILPWGKTVNSSGIYNDTLRSAKGCDSIINSVNLTVKPLFRLVTSGWACPGQLYTLPSGATAAVSGTYSDTIRYSSGCDSLISTVYVIIPQVLRPSVNVTICEGNIFMLPSGMVVNTQGTYKDTIRYTVGCDSLILTVNLTVKAVNKISTTTTICQGQNFILPSGKIVSTSGVYSDTLKYRIGCDSLITTVTVIQKPLSIVTTNPTICTGQNYTLPSGKTVNTAATYRDTLQYVSGCDSVINVVNLAVQTTKTLNSNVSICSGQNFILPSGKIGNTTGTYLDTVKYASGCDSLVATIKLFVQDFTTNQITATICQGQSYIMPSGKSIGSTGIHQDTLRYSSGCDSLVTKLNLTVKATTIINSTPFICEGETYTLPSGNIVTTAGTYSNTIKDMSGCDSIVNKINLVVQPNPTITITKSNDINCILNTATLTAAGGSKYTWSPSAGLSNPNIHNPAATPQTSTVYKVQVTSQAGCKSVDSIAVKVDKGNADGGYLLPSSFTPNGDGKNDCFGIGSWGYVTDLHFTIYNRWGNLVFTTTNASNCWNGTFRGKPQDNGTYVYQITANTLCGPVIRKGTVVLLR